MAFIKVQKLVRDGNKIISGSASIVDTRYVPSDKYHAKHSVIESVYNQLSERSISDIRTIIQF